MTKRAPFDLSTAKLRPDGGSMTKAAARVEDVGPTPEFRRHHRVRQIAADEAGSRKHFVEDQTLLWAYVDGQMLDERQKQAGDRFLADYREGFPNQSVIGAYDGIVDGGGWEPEGSEYHQKLHREAMQAIGIRCSAPVVHVVLYNGCIFGWGTARNVPGVTATAMLRKGLDRLVEHYGL